tara:strand:+ start:23229 stop:24524 length:1296 start_codon:yes stop_codon:yes gene_type:complete
LENKITNKDSGTLTALKAKKYRLFWTASIASVGATQLLTLTAGKLVFDLSGSELLLGLAAAVFGIGTILINFLGGVVADRIDKRILMIITSFAMTISLLLLAIIDALNYETVLLVVIFSTIMGLISGFDWPVRSSIFPQFIDKKSQMMSAVALNAMLWQGLRILAPASGGFIIAYLGTHSVFFISATGFFVMGLVMIFIKPNKIEKIKVEKKSVIKDTLEGINFIAKNKLFKVLILSTYITSGLGMSYLQLLPSFSNIYKDTIHGDLSAQMLGLLASAGGIGALTGTAVTARLRQKIKLGKLVLASNVLSVIFLFLFGLSNNFIFEENIYQTPWISYNLIISSILIIIIGLLNSIFMVGSMSLLQLNVPENLRGRVMGIHTITFSLMSAGALFLGFLAQLLSSSIAVMISAAFLILVNFFIYLKNSDIRNI